MIIQNLTRDAMTSIMDGQGEIVLTAERPIGSVAARQAAERSDMQNRLHERIHTGTDEAALWARIHARRASIPWPEETLLRDMSAEAKAEQGEALRDDIARAEVACAALLAERSLAR
jgi:hypothetical protein